MHVQWQQVLVFVMECVHAMMMGVAPGTAQQSICMICMRCNDGILQYHGILPNSLCSMTLRLAKEA